MAASTSQSPSFAVDSEVESFESALASELDVLFAGLEPERSLRAHPVPRKWTAGGAKTFFIWPPQFGHAAGPWPWTPCMTSMV